MLLAFMRTSEAYRHLAIIIIVILLFPYALMFEKGSFAYGLCLRLSEESLFMICMAKVCWGGDNQCRSS